MTGLRLLLRPTPATGSTTISSTKSIAEATTSYIMSTTPFGTAWENQRRAGVPSPVPRRMMTGVPTV